MTELICHFTRFSLYYFDSMQYNDIKADYYNRAMKLHASTCHLRLELGSPEENPVGSEF